MDAITVRDAVALVQQLQDEGHGTHDPVDVFSAVRLIQSGNGRSAIGVYGQKFVLAVASVLPGRFIDERARS